LKRQDSAESGNRIARAGAFQISIQQIRVPPGQRDYCCIDDDRGGIPNFRGEGARGFQVNEIIVGKVFYPEAFGR